MIRTRLDSATGHGRSIVRPNNVWNDQSTPRYQHSKTPQQKKKHTLFPTRRDPKRVENSLKSQPELDPLAAAPHDVDPHAVPVGIEQAVRVQQARDPGQRLARQELEERREVLRADVLGGEGRVAHAVRGAPPGERALGRERARGRGGPQLVRRPERRTEEPREGVAEPPPPLVYAVLSYEPCAERGLRKTHLTCAPSPIHAHSSAPVPTPGSSGYPHRS